MKYFVLLLIFAMCDLRGSIIFETSFHKKYFKYDIECKNNSFKDNFYFDQIHKAFDTWESIILNPPYENWLLELKIELDDVGYNLGHAIVEELNKKSGNFGEIFPVKGSIFINTYYKNYHDLRKNGRTIFYDTVLHEIGHTLGIGAISFGKNPYVRNIPAYYFWDEQDQNYNMIYTGLNALREYKNYFPNYSADIVGIPVENNGDHTTRQLHWEEGELKENDYIGRIVEINNKFHPGLEHELMTGWSGSDSRQRSLSKVSIGLLHDLGYKVDYSKADSFKVWYNNPNMVEASVDLGNDWKRSEWFGFFYVVDNSNWIYHAKFGWIFIDTKSTDQFWAYSNKFKWLWFDSGVVPFVYVHASKNYIYYKDNQYFDFTKSKWFSFY